MAKKTTKAQKGRNWSKILQRLFIASLGIYLSFFAFEFSKKYSIEVKPKGAPTVEVAVPQPIVVYNQTEPRPKYWFYMARNYMWVFFSVDNVLKKLGFEKIEVTVTKKQNVHNDWDLLWTYDYFNEIPLDFANLKYHQKINHIPGNYVLCLKDSLACNTDSKYIPKSFNNSKVKSTQLQNPQLEINFH